jgi:PD-(D/E)XK endonuclease
MKDTTSVGDLTEFEVATALMRTRKRVLRPLSTGLRYDLAIDNGDGTIVRVQCKTGLLRNGFISFRVCNADARRPQGIPYRGQIEAFGVYCPQNRRTYLVPIDAVGANISTARLRLEAHATVSIGASAWRRVSKSAERLPPAVY